MVSFQNLHFHDGTPVYLQICEHLKRQILLGTVKDGDMMPSRREMAAQTGINPNTAQKAYRQMETEGLISTYGNAASMVSFTEDKHSAIEDELTRGLVERFIGEAQANHLSYKKTIALISLLWQDE